VNLTSLLVTLIIPKIIGFNWFRKYSWGYLLNYYKNTKKKLYYSSNVIQKFPGWIRKNIIND